MNYYSIIFETRVHSHLKTHLYYTNVVFKCDTSPSWDELITLMGRTRDDYDEDYDAYWDGVGYCTLFECEEISKETYDILKRFIV